MKDPEQLFQGLDIKGPKIKTSKDALSLFPNYLNFSFISTFIPILIVIYIFGRVNEINGVTNLYILVVIVLSPLILLMQLKYYNTVVINFSDKTVSVIPNFILRLFVKKKIISFSDVKRFETISNANIDGGRAMFRRYIITLILKDSEKIKLISAERYPVAKQIEEKLSLLLK